MVRLCRPIKATRMEKTMSILAGKFARHIETGEVVQIVGTDFCEVVETGEKMMVVKYACVYGQEHYCQIESFMLVFEMVEDVKTVSITAHRDHEEFWAAVEDLASNFDVVMEDTDEIEIAVETGLGEDSGWVH